MMNNIKINNYKDALVEVEAVLDHLKDEEYIKIPKNIIDAIKTNKNEEYIFEYDEELDYANWDLMPEAKALLYNIFKQYLATNEQLEYFREKERIEFIQLEKEKAKQYNTNILFKDTEEPKTQINTNVTALVEIKENKWYKQILSIIRSLFKRK